MQSASNSQLEREAPDTSEQARLAGGTQAIWKNGLTAASWSKMRANAKHQELPKQCRALQPGGQGCKTAPEHGWAREGCELSQGPGSNNGYECPILVMQSLSWEPGEGHN